LRTSLASEINFAFLQKPLLMAQRHAGLLTANLQAHFAQAGANEIHAIRLSGL
jgi:hypothetical protein